MFAKIQVPIAKYNKNSDTYRLLNTQFAFMAGETFDL